MIRKNYTPEEHEALDSAAADFLAGEPEVGRRESVTATQGAMSGELRFHEQVSAMVSDFSTAAYQSKNNDRLRTASRISNDWDNARRKALARLG